VLELLLVNASLPIVSLGIASEYTLSLRLDLCVHSVPQTRSGFCRMSVNVRRAVNAHPTGRAVSRERVIGTDRWRSEPPCVYSPATAGHMVKRRVGVEYSPSILEPVRPGAVSSVRALCLPTFSHFLIVNKTSQPRGLRSPPARPALDGLQIPDGLVVRLAPATLEFWVRFPNEREPGKTGAPCVKVPGPSRVPVTA